MQLLRCHHFIITFRRKIPLQSYKTSASLFSSTNSSCFSALFSCFRFFSMPFFSSSVVSLRFESHFAFTHFPRYHFQFQSHFDASSEATEEIIKKKKRKRRKKTSTIYCEQKRERKKVWFERKHPNVNVDVAQRGEKNVKNKMQNKHEDPELFLCATRNVIDKQVEGKSKRNGNRNDNAIDEDENGRRHQQPNAEKWEMKKENNALWSENFSRNEHSLNWTAFCCCDAANSWNRRTPKWFHCGKVDVFFFCFAVFPLRFFSAVICAAFLA